MSPKFVVICAALINVTHLVYSFPSNGQNERHIDPDKVMNEVDTILNNATVQIDFILEHVQQELNNFHPTVEDQERLHKLSMMLLDLNPKIFKDPKEEQEQMSETKEN